MISRPDDWRSLYPFQSHEIRLDGWRYHYIDEGGGEPLLLVHGNPTWSFYWREIVKALRPQYRLIAPDHIGCGLSDKPQAYPYRLEQHIVNLRRLVEQLDLRGITLLAHDWGGAIGLGAATQMPERFARFVLFNTAAFRSKRCPWRIRVCRTPLAGQLAVQGLNAFARAALTMAVEHRDRMTQTVRNGFLAPYDTWANRIGTHRFVLDIPLSAAHPSYETLAKVEAGLSQFREHPVMLIWGMRDWCFTSHFLERFRAEFFPQAVVREIPDAGHYVVEDAYERIVPWLQEFLADR
jgi:haloalkane dehalogenase